MQTFKEENKSRYSARKAFCLIIMNQNKGLHLTSCKATYLQRPIGMNWKALLKMMT